MSAVIKYGFLKNGCKLLLNLLFPFFVKLLHPTSCFRKELDQAILICSFYFFDKLCDLCKARVHFLERVSSLLWILAIHLNLIVCFNMRNWCVLMFGIEPIKSHCIIIFINDIFFKIRWVKILKNCYVYFNAYFRSNLSF